MKKESVKGEGYRVTYERYTPGGCGRPVTTICGVKTNHNQSSKVMHQIRNRSGFVRIVKMEPLSAEQFAREFPPDRSRAVRQVSVRNYK